MLNDQDLAALINAELETAISLSQGADSMDGTGSASRRQAALDFYDGVLPANDDDSASADRDAVSLDVADMVEAVYAQMAPAIEDAGGIEFEAINEQDEEAAAQESAVVRQLLMGGAAGEGGYIALTEGIKDALLMRRATLALWIDRRESRSPEEWRDVAPEALGGVTAPTTPGQRIERLSIVAEEEGQEGTEEGAGEAPEGAGELYRVRFDRVDVEKRLAIEAIAPENFVSSSVTERDPNRCRFVADRQLTSRERLISEGFSRADVDKLKAHAGTYELDLDRGRSNEFETRTAQYATEVVEVWRCYVNVADSPGSPEAARYRVHYSRDSKVIIGKPQRVGRVCYAVGSVILYPHRLDGVSLFDRIGEVQALKSKALRNWGENLHKVNRPRLGVDESLCNLADARDATLDVIRIKGPNAILPIATVDAGPSVLAFLDYQDRARSERGGASLDMQAQAGAQIATNQTAGGIERQYSTKEQLAATMARTFAETAMRGAFQVAHYLLRTQWGDPLSMKIGGAWRQVNPAQWRARSGVVVRVGQSTSERRARAAALQGLMQFQGQMAQAGKVGILVDESRVFNAASDWIAASQLRNPERYLIDPSSPQAQQAAQQQAKQAQAQRLAQGEAANAAYALEKYKIDVSALTDLIGHTVKAAIEEAKLTLQPDPLQQATLGAAKAAGDAAGEVAEVSQKPGPGGAP